MNAGHERWIALIIFGLLTIFAFSSWADDKTISVTGEINDTYQLVSEDGKRYEIADNEKGNILVEDFVDQKVKITGTVDDQGGVLTITVIAFEALKN